MRHLTVPLLAAAASLLSTAPASAALGDQLFKLLPDDGAAQDLFGWSVAISGDTAIVAAYRDDDNGEDSGSAYLFDTTTGLQIAKLLPNDGEKGDVFGRSVAISGAIAIVAAPGDDDNGDDSGSAYLFDISGPAKPTQIAKLLAKDGAADDRFGWSVAVSGDTAIVAAYRDDDNGEDSGSAYLFDTTTGLQIAKLLPNDGAADDRFGYSVAISGDTAIVGAQGDDDNGDESGSAYLFDTTTGLQIAKLLPNDGTAHEHFGISVAISGATAIVGRWDDDNGTDSGSAYLFDVTDPNNPVQVAKLLADDGAADDRFGVRVAISGDIAIVAAHRDDDNGENSGSAYLFDIGDPSNPVQIAKLLPNDGAAFDLFGIHVAISGDTAVVGARYNDDNGENSGSAYLFDIDSSPCPWDLDGDGAAGPADLAIALGNWGVCPETGCGDCDQEHGAAGCSDTKCESTVCAVDPFCCEEEWDDVCADQALFFCDCTVIPCPGDLTEDGVVGPADLAFILGNWGPCP